MSEWGARVWRALGSCLRPHVLAQLVLFAYACALVIAAVQLSQWRTEVTHALLQLSADKQFLARVGQRGETIDPEWYRRKALSLLAITEKLDHSDLWSVVLPGSWHQFDDLQQRLAARIEQEFADVVVETMVRELYRRTSQLTGMPQHPVTGELMTNKDCLPPLTIDSHRTFSASVDDLPEFAALQRYVGEVEHLDAAANDFVALSAGSGGAERLQRLAEYTLGARLPTRLAQSAKLFRQREEVSVLPTIMLERLQWATRCTLYKGQADLHMRLFATNDLFALERTLKEEQSGLFTPAALALPFDQTMARYRVVVKLLNEEQALLEHGENAWMVHGISRLGPGYQKLLAAVAHTGLLGPDAIRQMNARSTAAFEVFRKQFEAAFGDEQPGLIWLAEKDRFALSPERDALRQGLASVLELPIPTSEPAHADARASNAPTDLTQAVADVNVLAEARSKFVTEKLPPLDSQTASIIRQVVDRRAAQLIFEKTHGALIGSLPRDRRTPLDPTAFRRQRSEVASVRANLEQMGAAHLARRLDATLDSEVTARLRLLQEQWRSQPLYSSAVSDLSTWNGDQPPLWRALGITDKTSLAAVLEQQSQAMDTLGGQAADLISIGGPALAQLPLAQLWRRMLAERDRYRRQSPNSSLLGFGHYLEALGDVRLENCAEKLGPLAPPDNDDDVALRWMELHGALTSRCFRLRSRPVPQPGTPPGLARGYERSPVSTVG